MVKCNQKRGEIGGTNMLYEEMGQRIRALRRAKRLTQQQLADMASMSPSFLGHVERGTRVLSVDTLMKLCEALQATPNDLLGVACPEKQLTEDQLWRFSQDVAQFALMLARRRFGTEAPTDDDW